MYTGKTVSAVKHGPAQSVVSPVSQFHKISDTHFVSGTINHVPEANKQTKSAVRADTSPTLRGGQSGLSRREVNIVIP